jgi:hypothetical protein
MLENRPPFANITFVLHCEKLESKALDKGFHSSKYSKYIFKNI